MKETLLIDFIKNNGKKFRLSLPYPNNPVVTADVKDLVQYAITNEVFNFEDGTKVESFDKATLYTTESSEIEVNMGA